MLKFYTFILPLFFVSLVSRAQIVTSTTMTPEELVQNVLLGAGVTATNITYNGSALDASSIQLNAGFFESNGTGFPLTSGVVLTSGEVGSIPGTNIDFSSSTTLTGSDPDLELIEPAGINDRCAIEFDFIPNGDSLKFKYIFASEEYPEFVNGGYNDAFGFFISGPGFAGPYSNGAENIALIPGTVTPVSIDNVNQTTNSAYYVDNSTDVYGQTVSFDAFTVILTAEAEVQCGLTYHIKLVIGDGGDSSYDSAVFLEAESFSSNLITVESNSNITGSITDTLLAEGCITNSLNFIRPYGSDTVELDIPIIITGTADTSADFSNTIIDTVHFNIGQDTSSLIVSPLDDGLVESIEYIQFGFYNVTQCGDSIFDSIRLYITDLYPLQWTLEDTIVGICPTVLDTAEVTNHVNSIGPYTHSWSFGSTMNPTELPQLQSSSDTVTHYVTITDGCGDLFYDSIVHLSGNIPTLTYNLEDTIWNRCAPDIDTVEILNMQNAPGPFNVSWSFGSTNNPEEIPSSINDFDTITYFVELMDGCNSEYLDSFLYIINRSLSIDSLIGIPSDACNPTGAVSAFVSGVTDVLGQPLYHWSDSIVPNGQPYESDATVMQNIPSGWYYFSVSDDVCSALDSVFVEPLDPPVAAFSVSPTSGCSPLEVNFANNSQNATDFEWHLNNESMDTVYVNIPATTTYTESATVMLVATRSSCSDTTYVNINVDPCPFPTVYAPNIFTPNNDGNNDIYHLTTENAAEVELIITNRWGNVVFESTGLNPGWDGLTNSGTEASEGVYFFRYKVTGVVGDILEGHGFLHLVRD